MTDQPNAFYRRDGAFFVPTGVGFSPWDGRSQNGAALAGLVGHILHQTPSRVPMHPARVTIDIVGTVPMVPLQAVVRLLRDGSRVQNVAIELLAEGRTWLHATAVRVRVVETPPFPVAPTRAPPAPDEIAACRGLTSYVRAIRRQGDFLIPGPGAQWVDFTGEVVAGEPLSPIERLTMLGDFGAASAPLLSAADWTFANVDISIHVTRLPRGSWLLIDAISESAGNGTAVSLGRLGDADGMIGTAHQTVFLDRRSPR